jgi:hypothetical protein
VLLPSLDSIRRGPWPAVRTGGFGSLSWTQGFSPVLSAGCCAFYACLTSSPSPRQNNNINSVLARLASFGLVSSSWAREHRTMLFAQTNSYWLAGLDPLGQCATLGCTDRLPCLVYSTTPERAPPYTDGRWSREQRKVGFHPCTFWPTTRGTKKIPWVEEMDSTPENRVPVNLAQEHAWGLLNSLIEAFWRNIKVCLFKFFKCLRIQFNFCLPRFRRFDRVVGRV